jgi:hypothetical protein
VRWGVDQLFEILAAPDAASSEGFRKRCRRPIE